MALNTASEVVSFARKLEEESAQFYEQLAKQDKEAEEIWLSFAIENKRNIAQIERAYYGVISDAIEGCFAFNINADEYRVNIELPKNPSDAFKRAIELEQRLTRFYQTAAEQSKSLMADVPRAFQAIAQKRENRLSALAMKEKHSRT